ncbi:MAG TPA: hypothetical protein VF258_00135, partial [Luteolibacter sp.]
MKKTIFVLVTLLITTSLVYVSPRIWSSRSARPLEGIFDVGMKCMGGHEGFLELIGDEAFDNCPGHRQRKKVADVVRDSDSATVIDPR